MSIKKSKHALDFIKFLNSSVTSYQAVHEIASLLVEHKFVELDEKTLTNWNTILKKNGLYFVKRNNSSIVAFSIGNKFKPGNGFNIVAAHTDSPCLKIKPVSKRQNQGYLQVGCQLYGGGIWHTWFDRDLSLAGRVVIKTKTNKYEEKLIRIREPILRIPTLAIHLDAAANTEFKFDKETQLLPVLCTHVEDSINKQHHGVLLQRVAKELDVEENQVQDLDLCLYDTQESALGGIEKEFIFSGRLDNLMMTYTALKGLIQSLEEHPLKDENNIRLIALFDNEEVGSESAYGANSPFLENIMKCVQYSMSEAENKPIHHSVFEESIANSYLLSADMAHAVHPNYSDKHEAMHKPKLHCGVVIKTNANQRYATTLETSTLLKMIAAKKNIPLQEFVVKNASPCGSTIGPILSSRLGLRTIDVGCPQLSMHSIREMAATTDVDYAVDLFSDFYGTFYQVEKSYSNNVTSSN